MRVEERDKRAEELKNQMMNVIPEAEEPAEEELTFEIPGVETRREDIVEEPEIVEEEPPKEEKNEKKKTDKQVSLFSF